MGGGFIQVSFRIFPASVEIDVLRGGGAVSDPRPDARPGAGARGLAAPPEPPWPAGQAAAREQPSFASWMAAVLKRERLSQEAAARQLGVSVKTVSRWVGGETTPRLRELRRIREHFGAAPNP
jgi:DNA-binding XRE family transcriptional regulator